MKIKTKLVVNRKNMKVIRQIYLMFYRKFIIKTKGINFNFLQTILRNNHRENLRMIKVFWKMTKKLDLNPLLIFTKAITSSNSCSSSINNSNSFNN